MHSIHTGMSVADVNETPSVGAYHLFIHTCRDQRTAWKLAYPTIVSLIHQNNNYRIMTTLFFRKIQWMQRLHFECQLIFIQFLSWTNINLLTLTVNRSYGIFHSFALNTPYTLQAAFDRVIRLRWLHFPPLVPPYFYSALIYCQWRPSIVLAPYRI